MSYSLQPHGLQPTRLLHQWNFPGKSGLSFPSPGDLPDPGTEPGFPTLQADALPFEPPGRPTVIQVYAPTTNAEEARGEQFNEDQQDLQTLTPKKKSLFHHRGLK